MLYLDNRTDGVAGVELVGDVAVVLPGHALANGGLHETGERGQHIDRGIDLESKAKFDSDLAGR